MNVFDLDQSIVSDYAKFARSFTQVRAKDIKDQLDAIYSSGRFWPDPLISINPHFEKGYSVDELAKQGTLSAETAKIFRVNGKGLTLHRHQSQAVAKAKANNSFVVTTGTGSGKSLCFFVPIIDHAVKAKLAGEPPRTKAIIIYPMNALANSQMKELKKFIEQSELPQGIRPTFARYTGQESEEERNRIRDERPDILLTNFMMLEMLMTRQKEVDRAVIGGAEGLDFLVLDELHTYRGRQGADVAMLVRRVRDRLCKNKPPICIGTSATMASEGGEDQRAQIVASVASRLFGASISSDCVIDESLQRATNPDLKVGNLETAVSLLLEQPIAEKITDEELRNNPLAAWIELAIGLEDGQRLVRKQPTTLSKAAIHLAELSQKSVTACQKKLQQMLTLMSKPAAERGGEGDRAFLAFKLHRFFSGAGHVYSTLRTRDNRRITLDGQLWDPHDVSGAPSRLYSTHFCRVCGQEYHPVTLLQEEHARVAFARTIDDPILEDEDGNEVAGYLMPDEPQENETGFLGEIHDYPEDWLEPSVRGSRLKSDKRKFSPHALMIDVDGTIGTGNQFWFIPGKFKFCLTCKNIPPGQAREYTKLASLSAEGRSSATTLLVSSTLRWMNADRNGVPLSKRKLLGFTDNRQDAALQAGHFNDFLYVSLLRAAVLAAVKRAGTEGLSEDEFGSKVQLVLGFQSENDSRRSEWMLEPDTRGVGRANASRNLTRVLSHRVWADQRRGWRYTNPNLEELGLVEAAYLSLDELVQDESMFESTPAALRGVTPIIRKQVYKALFDSMRKGLAITTEALDVTALDTLGTAARQTLREPWTIGQQERLRTAAALMLDAPNRDDVGLQGESLIVRAGHRSALAKQINSVSIWGRKLSAADYAEVVEALLQAAEKYQIVRSITTNFDVEGWQLAANAVRLIHGTPQPVTKVANPYFVDLYETLADTLLRGGEGIFGIEGREHTAQVDQERREWREWRFRWEDEDRLNLKEKKDVLRQAGEADDFLPVLFCSPTMELGVDISALNAVFLRNMPPTPANYAQRSGRAGRSGQAALVITYCSAQGPHDQYYFNQPAAMVRGVVRPPALDLANRDLVEAHLHAVWLAEAGTELASDIPRLLDLQRAELPIQQDLIVSLNRKDLATSSAIAMRRVLDSIDSELTTETAPWATDRDQFANTTALNAFEQFSSAFSRWRHLYLGARAQLQDANRRSEMHGLTAAERKEAKIQQVQANEQITLLERGNSGSSSDFYSYRYLATEGFLPGYNFPRLPLYAFVPAGGYQGAKPAYLQRARFLAIAEFGPRSLIYHEGRAYRVHKARLPSGARNAEGKLVTDNLYVCESCGAAHPLETERCLACSAAMNGIVPIRNILRIDNVETQQAERISANDEERQRQGFEIQTVFSWASRQGSYDVKSAIASDDEGPILRLDYAPGALISRVNLGLRRRSEKSIQGFGIDPVSGRWMKGPEEEENVEIDGLTSQRVVPIVQDNKNAMLIRLAGEPHSETVMATLQHALSRGLDMVFQLEEGETSSEPTPSRANRKAILSFEVSEGGAGVLSRLISERGNLARVARTALELMHFDGIDAAVSKGDPTVLNEKEGSNCVKGCYRCLLSYYNQPDHQIIDRTNEAALKILLRLARCTVEKLIPMLESNDGWVQHLRNNRLPLPDTIPLVVGDVSLPIVWRGHLVVATHSKLQKQTEISLESMGYAMVELPLDGAAELPVALIKLLRGAS
jgi:Lhr-like helicase